MRWQFEDMSKHILPTER